MKHVGYLGAGLAAALLTALFVRALPDAAARTRAGIQRNYDAACDVLDATSDNSVLGPLPAPAPDFALTDYLGREVRLSSLRGKVVMVNFWATWCPPCVSEMASLEKLTAHMHNRPFRLLAVSVDDTWQTVRQFFARGTPLEVLLDSKHETPQRFGTEKFPETFIIDKEGNIRYYVVNVRDWSQPAIAECLSALAE